MIRSKIRLTLIFLFGFITGCIGAAILASPAKLLAQSNVSTTTLQSQIDSENAKITQIQQEIAQLQGQLAQTTTQKKTLQSAIAQLNLNIQKITANIKLAQAQIAKKDATISVILGTIATTTRAVNREEDSAGQSLRLLDELDREPLVLGLIAGETLSDFFNQQVEIANLQTALQEHISALSIYKSNLENAKVQTTNARNELASFKQNLSSQQQGLVTAKMAQAQLLQETKNKESNYQNLIEQKKAEQAQFESELNQYQAQLRGVNASQVPPPGPVLAWPLASVLITQYFGNTPFATENPQIYNGHGHSGIDLAASPGTPVMAAAEGTVRATGNTDTTCPYASFGKWVFIDHSDGLGTLYAHLGTISVSQGQGISQGQVVGYSDTTGYATGPHLHFGVYAASAVKIEQLPTAVRCPLMIPIAPLSAYLNPLTYLPPVPK